MERSAWPWIALQLSFVGIVVAFLTFYLDSPYVVTLWILLGWSTIGQLVTLDDDMPGGWSNPDGDPVAWRRAKAWLALTFACFVLVAWLMYNYPWIRDYGW
nr:putative integron gene cassette protein [uncultured bacterium]